MGVLVLCSVQFSVMFGYVLCKCVLVCWCSVCLFPFPCLCYVLFSLYVLFIKWSRIIYIVALFCLRLVWDPCCVGVYCFVLSLWVSCLICFRSIRYRSWLVPFGLVGLCSFQIGLCCFVLICCYWFAFMFVVIFVMCLFCSFCLIRLHLLVYYVLFVCV